MEVTKKMVDIAQTAYDFAGSHALMDRRVRMKVALQAVFDSIEKELVSAEIAQPEPKEINNEGWIYLKDNDGLILLSTRIDIKVYGGKIIRNIEATDLKYYDVIAYRLL
jgi:hypothetical protein